MYEGIEQVHRYVAYQYFRDVGHTTDLASGSLTRRNLSPAS